MTGFQPAAPFEDHPDAYEAPNGVEAVLPGMPDDVGSRDPSATTIGGAVANAMAQMDEMRSYAESPAGTSIGDPIDLPPTPYQ